jgi:surfeit locus 1 family protein
VRAGVRFGTWLAVGSLLVLGGLFVTFGRWQWDRAAESRVRAERFESAAAGQALAAAPSSLTDGVDRFRRLDVGGAYLPNRQVLLDNVVHEGVAGYQVLTPLRADEGSPLLLVNRGWLPAGPDRRVLPDVAVDAAPRRVRGRLDSLPRPGLRLPSSLPDPPQRVTVLSYPEAADLAALLGEPVHDYQVLLDTDEPDGYLRDWHAPGLAPERHLAYAGQWFLFAAGAVAAAVVIAVRALRSASRSRGA